MDICKKKHNSLGCQSNENSHHYPTQFPKFMKTLITLSQELADIDRIKNREIRWKKDHSQSLATVSERKHRQNHWRNKIETTFTADKKMNILPSAKTMINLESQEVYEIPCQSYIHQSRQQKDKCQKMGVPKCWKKSRTNIINNETCETNVSHHRFLLYQSNSQPLTIDL